METVVNVIAGPLEYASAPFWDSKKNVLYFVNVFKSEIHKYDPATKRHTFAKVGDKPVAFIIPIDDFEDKYMIGYGCDLVAVTWDGQSEHISKMVTVETVEHVPGNRISDGKISPDGVLFVGTSGTGHLSNGNLHLNKGGLYSFKNCEIKKILSDISTSAGMAWNDAETTFYYTDCAEFRVERYCYDKETCDLGMYSEKVKKSVLRLSFIDRGCVMYEFKDDNLPGFPGGIAIDNRNHIWVSCFDGGQVLKINPRTGRAMTKLEIPHCPQITDLAFGGMNMDILFVTSANFNTKHRSQNAGSIFQVSGLGVTGCLNLPLRLVK